MGLEHGTAHVYAQDSWHAEASIVADAQGLAQIRDAAHAALEAGNSKALLFTADGEGYDLRFKRIDAEFGSQTWNDMTLPYVGIEYANCVGRELHDYWIRGADEQLNNQRRELNERWQALRDIIATSEDPKSVATAAAALRWSDEQVAAARQVADEVTTQ